MKTLPIITLILGLIIGALVMYLYSQLEFTSHVKQSIYDECFQYYAEANKAEGISKDTISTCWTKANDWTKEVKK